jgi:hypothetical protein
MAELKNPRWERFAQLCVLLNSASEAYRKLCGERSSLIKNIDVNSSQLLAKPGVRERVSELRRENDRQSKMSRKELLDFYAQVIRTPADQVPEGSPVVQSYEVTESGHKIRICDKIAAGAQLQKMCDWNSAERIELSASSLTEYLSALRAEGAESIGGHVIELERPALPLKNGNGEESRG